MKLLILETRNGVYVGKAEDPATPLTAVVDRDTALAAKHALEKGLPLPEAASLDAPKEEAGPAPKKRTRRKKTVSSEEE